ncbi:sugar transferase [Vampirovibrio chlorellavorus]|uniref:sugar transferase n=1 Tax=Vampirovibrio chlorellavorus TaxID=758823 RepID=UPI0026EF0EAF|nr:sugar transferase [Vampirovibrio chlorellavorus]
MSTETLRVPFKNIAEEARKTSTSDFHRTYEDPLSIAINYNVYDLKPCQWFIKRGIDYLGSGLGLLMILPLLLLVGLIIRMESQGPVIYKQKRVGVNGKEFEIYKFRSMHINAEKLLYQLLDSNEISNGMFKMQHDPRVTRVGKWLRKFSIDELPQLLNVLKGDMSLVGPRPPIKTELQHYKHWHYFRFATLPGLTGLWQVNGRSSIKEFDQVVELDCEYIRKWSLWLDFKLLLKTVPVVLFAKDTA